MVAIISIFQPGTFYLEIDLTDVKLQTTILTYILHKNVISINITKEDILPVNQIEGS